MVSRGAVALVLSVLAQAALSSAYTVGGPCQCQCPVTTYGYEETCCPGPVVEQKYVVPKTATESFLYTEPVYSKQCYQQPSGVARNVLPSAFETAPVCETQQTVVSVPTTDFEVKEQPLCRTTCTTSEYVIQIPIVETTCTSAPLCKKTVRTQDNVLTTVSQKTSCAKNICTQNQITETPLTDTVCQNYQGAVSKVGTKTVVVPEVHKKCVQLPPTKCLKPTVSTGVVSTSVGAIGIDNGFIGGPCGDAYVGPIGGYPGYAGYDAGFYGPSVAYGGYGYDGIPDVGYYGPYVDGAYGLPGFSGPIDVSLGGSYAGGAYGLSGFPGPIDVSLGGSYAGGAYGLSGFPGPIDVSLAGPYGAYGGASYVGGPVIGGPLVGPSYVGEVYGGSFPSSGLCSCA